MSIHIKAPTFPGSVQGSLAKWHKQPGEFVGCDELLAEVETDIVTIEVVSPADGTLTKINKQIGDIVESNEIIASLEAVGNATTSACSKTLAEDSADGDQNT